MGGGLMALIAYGAQDRYIMGNYKSKGIKRYTDYLTLARFGRLCLKKIKMNRLKKKRWIHGELLCKPPTNSYPGGSDYHEMVSYFNKL